jgi:hypothetical protein
MLEAGTNIAAVSEILGYAAIGKTYRCVRATPDTMTAVVEVNPPALRPPSVIADAAVGPVPPAPEILVD